MSSKNPKPVILQVIPALGQGGAEQGCLAAALGIVQAGGVALVTSSGGHLTRDLQRIGATHISLPVHSKNPIVMWRNIHRLRTLIKTHKVDIVHARSRAPAWSAFYACHGTNARFMTTCHAPYPAVGRLKHWYNSIMARGERVIAISHFVADYLRREYGIGDDVIRIVPRGTNLDHFRPGQISTERINTLIREWRLPYDKKIILVTGRLTRWKGQGVLVEALSQLKRDDVFTVILGDDQGRTAYREELEARIAALALGDQVRFVKHCQDMAAAYALSAAVLSVAIEPEGFGRMHVEGMAMGRPVIATAIGGAAETIIDGETGFLVPPNDPAALAKSIDSVLDMPEDAQKELATRAIAHVAQNYTREQMIDKTLAVYAELLPQ